MGYYIPNPADAAYDGQGIVYSSNFNDLAVGIGQSGATCEVTASTGMTLDVAAGVIQFPTGRLDVGSTTVEIGANDPGEGGSNPRIDIVQVDWTGAVSVVEGDAAAVPVEPDVTAHAVKIAAVVVPSGATEILSDMISDRRIGVTDAAVVSRGLPSTSFVYNSSSTEQSGTRYNDWEDLCTALADARFGGPRNLIFEQDETLPVGAWDLTDVTMLGNGISYGLSQTECIYVTLPTGFTFTHETLRVGAGLVVESTSSAPIIHVVEDSPRAILLEVHTGASIATTTAPFVLVDDAGAITTIKTDSGGTIHGGGGQYSQIARAVGGYEVVSVTETGHLTIFTGTYGTSAWDNDLYRSSVGGCTLLSYFPDISASPPAAERSDSHAHVSTTIDTTLVANSKAVLFPTGTSDANWDGGRPANVNLALHRLANAVSGLLSGDIP
jgi:hypothetical protein